MNEPNSQDYLALINSGVLFYHAGNWDGAIASLERGLARATELGDRAQQSVAHYHLALSHQAKGESSQAVAAFIEAYRLFQQQEQTQFMSQVWQQLTQQAQQYFEQQQFQEALTFYRAQVEIATECEDFRLAAWSEIDVGKVLYYRGQFQDALACHLPVLEKARSLPDRALESLALAWVGCDKRELGELEKALEYFELRYAIATELQNSAAVQETLGWLIDIAKRLKNLDKTVFYYKEKLAHLGESSDRPDRNATLYDLAMVQFNARQYGEAIEEFQQALGIAEQLKNIDAKGKEERVANAKYMLGRCAQMLGEKEGAIAYFQQAVKIYVRLDVKNWAAKGLEHLASLHRKLKRYEDAIAAQQQRLELVRELRDRISEQSTFYNLGCLYNDRQEWNTAIEYFNQALSLAIDLEKPYKQANAYYKLGSSYRNLDQKEDAIASYQKAVNLYVELEVKDWAVKGLEFLAILYRGLQRYEEAIAAQQRRLELVRELRDRVSEQGTFFDLGCLHDDRQEWNTAIEYFQKALNLAIELEQRRNQANANYMLGSGYQELDQKEDAIACYQKAVELYVELEIKDWAAKGLENLAELCWKLGRYEETIEYLNKTQKFYTENSLEWASLQISFGNAYLQTSCGNAYFYRVVEERDKNLEFAIAYYKAALKVFTFQEFPQEWAEIYYLIGMSYYLGHKRNPKYREEAIIAYETALRVYSPENNPRRWAEIQNSLGAVYQQRTIEDEAENKEKALSFYQLALTVYEREVFPDEWAETQSHLGGVYTWRIRGDLAQNKEKAITAYENALSVWIKQKYPKKWAWTKFYMGLTYQFRVLGKHSDNLEKAIDVYNDALSVFSYQQFPSEWGIVQNSLGEIYKNRIQGDRLENLKKALDACQASNEILADYRERNPEGWARMQLNLGDIFSNLTVEDRKNSQQYLNQAKYYYEAGLEIFNKENYPERWATTQNCLSNIYRSSDLDKVIELHRNALQVFTHSAFPERHAETLFNLGTTYWNKQCFTEAYNAFEQSIETVDYLRGETISGDKAKRKVNEKWVDLYALMVQVCIRLKRYNKAVEYADRSKARNLAELMAARDLYGSYIPESTRLKLQQLRQNIAKEKERLQQVSRSDFNYLNQLREEFNRLSPYQPLMVKNIQDLLDEETAIVEWYVSFIFNQVLTFTVLPNSPESLNPVNSEINLWQSSPEDFNHLIDWTNAYLRDYRNSKAQWQKKLPQRLETLTHILHLDEILHNLRTNFPTCKKLILIPHRFLHLFPLHTLPIPTGENQYQTLQELFPQGVSYAPNCQVLKQAQNRPRLHFNSLFAVQNPTEDPNLDFTDLEVAAIQHYFNPSQVLKKRQAQKIALDFTEAHCTHFSCHGYFNFDNPLKSALILADSELPPPPPQDDQTRYLPQKNGNLLDLEKCLTLEDILRLDLRNCRLVTLSACETGITDFTSTSDEYIGLPSAFILAGSPNVVCSLWAVSDTSTALLMVRFYQNLKTKEMTVSLALREAQNWLRDASKADLEIWAEVTLNPNSKAQLKYYLKKAPENPFDSPYYWAAFCAIGS